MSRSEKFENWYYGALATFGALVVVVPTLYFGARELWPNPLVGECVKQVDHTAPDLTFEEVGCSGRSGRGREFEVGAIEADCPPGDYTAVARDDEKTCYLPAFSIGVCFVSKQFRNTTQPVRVRDDCAEPGALKVDDMHEDISDKRKCGNPDISLTFSQPARTVCMKKP